jgi:hypothetical protein
MVGGHAVTLERSIALQKEIYLADAQAYQRRISWAASILWSQKQSISTNVFGTVGNGEIAPSSTVGE